MTENYTANCTANLGGHAKVIFITLNAFSCCMATSGNTVVLLAVYKIRSLRTISNFFICSLATADLLVGLLINPLYIALVSLGVWVSDHPLYLAENYLWIHSLTVTTFSLAAVSVDRYIAITKLFRYKEILTKRRCAAIIISIWAFSLIIGSLVLFIDPEDGSKAWVTCQITTVGIPLVIMGYCYYHIYWAAKRQSCHIHANTVHIESNTTQLQKNRQKQKSFNNCSNRHWLVRRTFFSQFRIQHNWDLRIKTLQKTRSVSELVVGHMAGFLFICIQPVGVRHSHQGIQKSLQEYFCPTFPTDGVNSAPRGIATEIVKYKEYNNSNNRIYYYYKNNSVT